MPVPLQALISGLTGSGNGLGPEGNNTGELDNLGRIHCGAGLCSFETIRLE